MNQTFITDSLILFSNEIFFPHHCKIILTLLEALEDPFVKKAFQLPNQSVKRRRRQSHSEGFSADTSRKQP